MKSERRHELQQNTLARSLENLPKMGKDSGSKLLLGVVTVLLVIVLIRFYLNNREQKQEQTATQLANARVELTELQGALSQNGGETAALRNDFYKKVEGSVAEVLSSATDGPHVAQAKNLRADANLQMATFGQPTEATTRPDLALPHKPEEMLDEAARGYQEVLGITNGVPPTEVANARFGLAAVAENRGDWGKAREQYDTIISDANLPQVFHDYASQRLTLLDRISKPVVLGQPSTRPFDLALSTPASGLKMGPFDLTTAPAAPTTGPAIGPTSAPVLAPGVTPPGPTTAPAAPATTPTTPTTAPDTAPAVAPTQPIAPATKGS